MVEARFPPTARLRNPKAYRRVFRQGDRKVDACFVVIAASNGHDWARLGLAISKRNARRAVDRNRIKRLVRESFRACAGALPGVDIVVIARSGTAARAAPVLRESLDRHWQRVIKAHASVLATHPPSDTLHG